MDQLPLILDRAEPSEVPAILRLYREAGIVGDREFDVAQAQAQLASFSRYPFHHVYVAKEGGRIVGTYELILVDNLAKAGAKTALVEDVAVDPAAQKRGIGRAMMLHARKLAREHGAYKLTLSSNRRRKEAHAFYEKLGFVQHGLSFLVDL